MPQKVPHGLLYSLRASNCVCASDPTPSPAKTFSRSSSSGDIGMDLIKEETPNSMV